MDAPEDALPVAGTVVLLRPAAAGFEVLLLRRPAAGSFAGAWVFPGGKVEPSDIRVGERECDDAMHAGIRETFEEVGLIVDGLMPLSVWSPPIEAPTRIRTWFFLAAAPDGDPTPAPAEVAEVAWIRPEDALARHGAGDWLLFPPTWMTLHHLASFTDAASALAAAGAVQRFDTVVAGRTFVWAHGRLDAAGLPWSYLPNRQGWTGSAVDE